jgi:hypothetical protein
MFSWIITLGGIQSIIINCSSIKNCWYVHSLTHSFIHSFIHLSHHATPRVNYNTLHLAFSYPSSTVALFYDLHVPIISLTICYMLYVMCYVMCISVLIGGMLASHQETIDMLNFCAKHNIVAATEEMAMTPSNTNAAFKRGRHIRHHHIYLLWPLMRTKLIHD